MKTFFKFTLIAALFTLSFTTNAQDLKKGYIQYEVTDIKSEEMEAMMMKGTLINFYFNQVQSKMNVQMMGGMVAMDILTETETDNTVLLMNMMGRKVKVNQEKADSLETAEPEKPDFDIVYDKADTKEIAGKKCIKAVLTDKKTNEKIDMYIAKGLMPKVKMAEDMFPGLKGLPMEINLTAQGMGVTITAQKVENTVDLTAFDIPEGYEEMTPEQFQKEMGGMGNFGF